MKEPQFDSNIENIYTTLSDEQKTEYKTNTEKLYKSFYAIEIVLLIISIAFTIGISIYAIVIKDYAVLVATILGLGFVAISIFSMCSSRSILKATDEVKIKTHIKRLETQKQLKQQEAEKQLQKNVYYRLSVDNIKTVTILDSYTELSDKLHAILNYQEIIQTRVYKFNVTYNDETSKVVTAPENSEEYAVLMPLVGKGVGNQTTVNADNNIEKLREYKKLLDDGIITQEEFEQKKKELL